MVNQVGTKQMVEMLKAASPGFPTRGENGETAKCAKWKAGRHAKAKIYQSTNIDGSIYGSTNLSIRLAM